ncbi:16S rRNA (uracil(1498)-N(3))-methyltransferase [Sphingomonas lacunae]|uniref:Ribosomal RNA small subunit methyltransferase E n=1 Tax=Sphingomonas lacunae TaxID=2698828 RepID=A0A6M4AW78_9SPHN|nr:16S rRNA (uracil(1498)-N(3))-methyltransferase [Sphingomonas lacunae]QJQ33407.1 16S rRNA (uracil(1498)-N(3))-methyltransferase [Sphingomonas lacunae]
MPATPAWPPRSAPRLFVEPLLAAGGVRHIDGNAAHYLCQVMRVKPGDAVILCDNESGEWAARVETVAKRHVDLVIVERLRVREAVPDLWLVIAPVKKPNFDLVLEKATELGVDRIVPVLTRRSVVDKVNLERARTIMTEAAEQCARTALPSIAELVPLAKLLAAWPNGRCLFMADELGGEPAAEVFAAAGAPAAILIGPEGGFDDAERQAIRALPQARPITLGPRILRAETAAIAATSLWMACAGDWR